MSNYREQAIAFADKQAAVKPMSAAEYAQCIRETEKELMALDAVEPEAPAAEAQAVQFACDPKRAIKENTITCAICGKSFRILTARHMESHGLTTEQYRALCGYKPGTPLVAKALQRERREKMQSMRLWEKTPNNKKSAAKQDAESEAAPVKPKAAKPTPKATEAAPAGKTE